MRLGYMALALPATLVLTFLASVPAQAQLTFFTTRPAFNLACPGLALEDFEKATIAPIGLSVIANPLDKTTNNGVFTTGAILNGLRVTSSNNHAGQALGVIAAGLFGNPSKLVYNNFSGDALNLSFYNANVSCVGLDILDPAANGVPLTVNLYGIGNVLLGTSSVSDTQSGTFFGVSSTNIITQITLVSNHSGNKFEGVDNIAFGASANTAVPEPGSIALLTGMGTVGAAFLRRRKQVQKAA